MLALPLLLTTLLTAALAAPLPSIDAADVSADISVSLGTQASTQPAAWAVSVASEFALSTTFEITDVPTTREYYWDISSFMAAPDGFAREIVAVNGQYPGPLIEANEGDTLLIHVTNSLTSGQSLHWHGITQNGSQWMDGVPGFSQCPIPAGQTFTYKYTLQQYGTFWWHSHYAATLADGLAGPIIVHSVNDPVQRGVDFDEERVLMVSDWLYILFKVSMLGLTSRDDNSDTVVQDLMSSAGYRGSPASPQGDSVLLNGVGVTNCSGPYVPAGSNCTTPPPAEITVPVGKKIRFRLINSGAHEMLRVSIDNHTLEVVEADDTPVYGPLVHEVSIDPGQRYSFILDTSEGDVGDAFWIRASVAIACTGTVPQVGTAVLRYVSDATAPSTQLPDTEAWSDLAAPTDACLDMDQQYSLVPRIAENAPTDILTVNELSSIVGTFVNVDHVSQNGFFFNDVSYQNLINYPFLTQIHDGLTFNSSLIANATFPQLGGGDLIVNNLDGFDHPYHLHGRSFFLVGRGSGIMTADGLADVQVNTTNPLRRDTLHIPAQSWAVLRLITDTPGVWPLHCHIAWHLALGKVAAVLIQPDRVKEFDPPADWQGMCSGVDRGAFGPP